MKSNMLHTWDQVPAVKMPRSVFNLSHSHKTAFDGGKLIPILAEEVLPGDTWNLRATYFARLQTLKFPVMDNLFLDSFFFFVPLRLLWEHFEQFMGSRDTVAEIMTPTEYLTPVLGTRVDVTNHPYTIVAEESLSDYLGLPLSNYGEGARADLYNVSAFFHRAYYKIYNAWFRDQNLIDPLTEDISDGPDITAYAVQRRAKKKDYFTACLPWPQKGPAIEMPLGSTAPVIGTGYGMRIMDGDAYRNIITYDDAGGDVLAWSNTGAPVPVGTSESLTTARTGGKVIGLVDSNSGIVADLSQATAATINSIREAFQLQRLLERDARGGTRYIEQLKAQFGVTSPDFRLQRPELLAVSSARINVHPVQQTSESTETSPQGKLSAYALCADTSAHFVKSFVEHGVLLGIVNVRADLTYQQGTPRKFNRRTRYDYYLPVLANLGEQEVLTKEIYSVGGDSDDAVFGYIPRWDEYRFSLSQITGVFRSEATASLDAWHLSQELTDTVVLGKTFIEDNPPLDRVVAVTDEPEIIFDSYFQVRTARVMPTFGVPGLIDHF